MAVIAASHLWASIIEISPVPEPISRILLTPETSEQAPRRTLSVPTLKADLSW